jgi:hypothetical protein
MSMSAVCPVQQQTFPECQFLTLNGHGRLPGATGPPKPDLPEKPEAPDASKRD